METKINIINIPILKGVEIQRSYIFNNDFRFEVSDNININCIITVYIPIGKIETTEYGTAQQCESKRINKDCYINAKITDICYNINNNGIISRVINVEILESDKYLLKNYINSEILSQTIDFE